MRNLLKGFRSESKRDSLEAGSIEELYGLPGAVPFKWEESPGKAKPPEKDTVLQLEGSHKFYNRLLRREGSMGQSSALYGTAAHGNVPFKWEAEPGKPKTPTREAEHSTPPPPLSRPPSFQSPAYTIPSSCTVQPPSEPAPKRFAKKVMKFLFPGRFPAGISKAPSSANNSVVNSKQSASNESASSFDSLHMGSDESGVFESFSWSRSSSFKSFSLDDTTSEFSNEEAAFRVLDPASSGCFSRCPPRLSRNPSRSFSPARLSRNPSRSFSPARLSRNPSRSRNSVSDEKRISSFDVRSAYLSAVARIRRLADKKSSVVIDNKKYLQREGGSEFQGTARIKTIPRLEFQDNARIKTTSGSEFQESARIKTIPSLEFQDSARIKTISGSEFQESARIKTIPARIKTIPGLEFQDNARIKTISGSESQESARIKTIQARFKTIPSLEFQDSARMKTISGSEFQESARIKTIPGLEFQDNARIKTITGSEFQESARIKAIPDWRNRQANISLQEYVGLTGYYM